VFKLLITNAGMKHAIALARYIQREMPDVEITAHDAGTGRAARFYSCFHRRLFGQPLEEVLRRAPFDMVIPVASDSVPLVAAVAPHLAVLPSQASLETCYNKWDTLRLARSLHVPAPEAFLVQADTDLRQLPITFPCVVQAAREDVPQKQVLYPRDLEELARACARLFTVAQNRKIGVMVQEYVPGTGCGLFALYDRGRAVRLFMHQRLREFPASGGASTAAAAVECQALRQYGLRLLDALHWNGVAMVEFKGDSTLQRLTLMEINAKFWGSAELGLRAGVNFGADLVRVFRGQELKFSDAYDRSCRFYWPLDDDLLGMFRSRNLRGLADYLHSGYSTNVGQSWRADAWKLLRLTKKLVLG
jgi:predicted ATP-grasp superfamily ATP-dependent carboligase